MTIFVVKYLTSDRARHPCWYDYGEPGTPKQAATAAEAVALLRRAHPKLIVLDVYERVSKDSWDS
jgi:hypothetical protein